MIAPPPDTGTMHFVGIGGIGMSGIAEVLHNLGYRVQGSDLSENANVRRMRALGVPVRVGHAADNLGDAAVVVVSSAVAADNPEVVEARTRLLPVVRRAEMLAELMRLKYAIAVGGTHGKTTTTTMIAAMLDAGGLDPTVINGGIINAYGTNARLGAGDWMVAEADESDGSFVRLPATVAVVTNIDPEHLEFYGDFDRLRRAFQTFVENIPFYGSAVACVDHAEVRAMVERVTDRRVVTYGFSPDADLRAEARRPTADGSRFDVVVGGRLSEGGRDAGARRIADLELRMPGAHNVENALAAVAIGLETGLGEDTIRAGLASFSGVRRRFTTVGRALGITVIDDYGHHPTEISAVLATARERLAMAGGGQLIAVVQPHRYTRLHNLFDSFCTCFGDADTVLVADVYAAGEPPIEGVGRDRLVAGLRAHGHRGTAPLSDPAALPSMILDIAGPGDLVVCLGAGDITRWANGLPAAMQALDRARRPAGAAQ